MEPIWVLLRCYRALPGGACQVLGSYRSAADALEAAAQLADLPVDAWREPQPGHQLWHASDHVYEYRLESFELPAQSPPPPVSIETHSDL